MRIELDPPRAFGPVRIGMSLAEAEPAMAIFGDVAYEPHNNALRSMNDELGLMVTAVGDPSGRVTSVVSGQPYNGVHAYDITMHGIDMLAPVDEVLEAVARLWPTILMDDQGYIFMVPNVGLIMAIDDDHNDPTHFVGIEVENPENYEKLATGATPQRYAEYRGTRPQHRRWAY